MKIKVSENIRHFRKEHSLTQEQLAEALDVTIGAVYKWEAGLSFPEIRTLIELANLFEISVDTLLGYEQQNGNVDAIAEQIERLRRERNFDTAVQEAEKALKKYPNNFKIVYQSAITYQVAFLEEQQKNFAEKSILQCEKAISLLYQNNNTNISEITIRNMIAQNHLMLGEAKQALQIFKANNVCGINNALIGSIYANILHQPQEASHYLIRAFSENFRQLLNTMAGFINVYKETKNNTKLKETLQLLCELMESIKECNDSITFADRYIAVFTAIYGLLEAENEDYDKAEDYLRKAFSLAIRFDAAPVFGVQGIKFFDAEETNATIFDELDESAVTAIESIIYNESEDGKEYRFVQRMWSRLKEEY